MLLRVVYVRLVYFPERDTYPAKPASIIFLNAVDNIALLQQQRR